MLRLLIVDPFAETHSANENDNAEMLKVAQMYREIAQKANAAVCIVHHTRKPPQADSSGMVGNMDSGRGASSIAGVARVVVTLYNMSKKDAKHYNVKEEDRHRYVRLDDAKANLSLLKGKPVWFKRISVPLETTDIEGVEPDRIRLDTSGQRVAIEEVGALEFVDLMEVVEDATPEDEPLCTEGVNAR